MWICAPIILCLAAGVVNRVSLSEADLAFDIEIETNAVWSESDGGVLHVSAHPKWLPLHDHSLRMRLGGRHFEIGSPGAVIEVKQPPANNTLDIVLEVPQRRTPEGDITYSSRRLTLGFSKAGEVPGPKPRAGADLDAILRANLQPTILVSGGSVQCDFERHRLVRPELANTAIAVAYAIQDQDGKDIAHGSRYWLAGPDGRLSYAADDTMEGDLAALLSKAKAGDDLTVVLTGSSQLAAKVVGAAYFWDGTLSLPARIIEVSSGP